MASLCRGAWHVVYILTVVVGLSLVGLGLSVQGTKVAPANARSHSSMMSAMQSDSIAGMAIGSTTGMSR